MIIKVIFYLLVIAVLGMLIGFFGYGIMVLISGEHNSFVMWLYVICMSLIFAVYAALDMLIHQL